MTSIPRLEGEIPYLTTAQMRAVDQLMIEEYDIEILQMMENAGRNLAHLARERFFDGDPIGKRVAVLAGTGGNGGDALVSARRLHSYGAHVEVHVIDDDAEFAPVSAHLLAALRRIGARINVGIPAEHPENIDLVIDGVIGYSLAGAPRGIAAELIRWANDIDADVLAVDVPSGVDASNGEVFDPAISAAATMALALPKEGLRTEEARARVGELYLADIGVPPELYRRQSIGLEVGHIFSRSDIVRVW